MARPCLLNSVKFKALTKRLALPRPYVLGLLETLWSVGWESGNPILGTAQDVEVACEWPGEEGVLFKALKEARWVDEDAPGIYSIHHFWHHCPDYVEKRHKREMERQNRGTTIREERQRAAKLRWGKAKPEQTSANELQIADACTQKDATVLQIACTPAPAPAPLNTISAKKRGRASAKEESESFKAFWEAYPRKVAREAALKAWDKLELDAKAASVMAHLERCMADWTEPRFTPHPATWLNREDFAPVVASAGNGKPPFRSFSEFVEQHPEVPGPDRVRSYAQAQAAYNDGRPE